MLSRSKPSLATSNKSRSVLILTALPLAVLAAFLAAYFGIKLLHVKGFSFTPLAWAGLGAGLLIVCASIVRISLRAKRPDQPLTQPEE